MRTIKEIAKEAGVSYSTVSRALSGSAAVSEETRRRVLAIAERLGYVPNKAAQMLVEGRSGHDPGSRLISVVYGSDVSLNDYYFSTVFRSIVDEASRSGYASVVTSVSSTYDSILGLGRKMKGHLTMGLILVGNVDDRVFSVLGREFGNCVVVDKPMPGVTSVYNDNEKGAYEAVSHLARIGCRRIAAIVGPPGHYFTEAMLGGYRRALVAASLPPDEALVSRGEFHIAGGQAAMQQLIDAGVVADGVFSNDEMAIGAMEVLRQRGLRVPEDVCVFGFDNLALGEHVTPTLSTVNVYYGFMARTAVRKVIENAERRETVPVNILIPVELVIRDSTRRGS